jgi:hypothetical protein
MSLQAYVTTRMGAAAWASLQPWYDALRASADLQLIQRNIDRECFRGDITAHVWIDFLLDVSATHTPPDACDTIDRVLGRRRSYFTLAGLPLTGLQPTHNLFRFMRLDHVLKYMLTPLPITVGDYTALANTINTGVVWGAHLDSKPFGRPDYPTWCTLSDYPAWRANADRARDRFGLKHIDSGHLVEICYPVGLLQDASIALKPPTVLDSWAGGASNWIFAKKRGAGGPDVGYTVDMDGGVCRRGSTELVHGYFRVPAGGGSRIGLRVHGPLVQSSPAIDFGALLVNPAI